MDAYIIYQSHIAIVMNAIGKTGTSQISPFLSETVLASKKKQ